MFGWNQVKSPITVAQQDWIEEKFAWLLQEFGDRPILSAVVTPTDEFFPDPYTGSQEDALALFQRVCLYMQVDARRIDVSFFTTVAVALEARAFNPTLNQNYGRGRYSEENSRIKIELPTARMKEPIAAVACMAHDLGNVHLLGDRRYSAESEDRERLADLVTIFFGLGIFSANAVVREVYWGHGQRDGWPMAKAGWLSHPELAYALAVYAQLRGDSAPTWSQYLQPDMRVLFQSDLKRIQRNKHQWLQGQPLEPHSTEGNEEEQETTESKGDADRALEEEATLMSQRVQESADHYFTQGVALVAEHEYEAAIEAFSSALEVDPDDAEIRLHRADACLKAERFQQAVADCTEGLRYDPKCSQFHRTRAAAKVWLRDYRSALDDLEMKRGHDKHDPLVYMLRAIAYCGIGNLELAQSEIEYAIRKGPLWPNNYLVRSQIYRHLGKPREADADLSEAIRREPSLQDPELRKKWLGGAPIR